MIAECVYLKKLENGIDIGLWCKDEYRYYLAFYPKGEYAPERQMRITVEVELKELPPQNVFDLPTYEVVSIVRVAK